MASNDGASFHPATCKGRFAARLAARKDALPMVASFMPDLAVGILREVIVALVRKDGPALSTHQLGVFLTCYLKDGDHTVRGLAAELNVSKSVITRALDKLGELDLAQRRPDPSDRRSVLVERTGAGRALIEELKSISVVAVKAAEAA
jgi:DNA-binding MarR family transcriptional regulator